MNLMIIKNILISTAAFISSACTQNSTQNFSGGRTNVADTAATEKSQPFQMGNVINNAFSLAPLQNKIRRADTAQTLINVLHIGDSHIKSGFYSEPFMQKLNQYYMQRYGGKLFFNFQWFCKIGTKYSDYNDLAELDNQLVSSQFDLVIISLGTNDAFSGSSRVNFYEKIDHLVKKIQMLAPKVSILITTPPDALKMNPARRSYAPLPELINVVNTIVNYCITNKIAFWNLHQIMGGTYSINRWIMEKKAAPDRVHFTAAGYGQFADWLYEAFTKTIN